MHTLIQAGWIVGHRAGCHELLKRGELVFAGDRIVHVGFDWRGPVDARIDAPHAIVCPGFIDTHVHSGHRALHRLLTDTGRPELLGQPFLEIALRRPGNGDPRSAMGDLELQAEYTVAELLRHGFTSFVEFGSNPAVLAQMARAAERLGIRAWLGAGFESHVWVADTEGRRRRRTHADEGLSHLEAALAFIDTLAGRGRLAGLLVPRDADTVTPTMLEQSAKIAAERGLLVAIHAAYNPWEFHEVLAEHGCTPIELLERVGLLGPRTLIGHGNYLDRHFHHSGGRDLERLAASGATVSHCPVNLLRRGRVLDHWGSYRAAGVPIALGTDTYPRDPFEQMRAASYMAKSIARDYFVASAAEMFDAATIVPARWLGRADLGRLEPGAQADIAIVELGRLRHGPVLDPIRTLVECAVGDDVSTVIVAGQTVVDRGAVRGASLERLLRAAQAEGEAQWQRVGDWDPLGRSAAERSPPSYPVRRR